jgi:hypothetical protein
VPIADCRCNRDTGRRHHRSTSQCMYLRTPIPSSHQQYAFDLYRNITIKTSASEVQANCAIRASQKKRAYLPGVYLKVAHIIRTFITVIRYGFRRLLLPVLCG